LAQLSIYRGGRLEGVFYLPDKPVLIGRADGVDIQLLDSRVSRRHAVIRESVAGYIIQDLDTKNGTFVNDEAVERSLLFHSDAVVIGGYTLSFLEEDEQDASLLDSGFVAPLASNSLQVPGSLSDRGPGPRAHTSPRPGGAPPERVNRLDRQREAGQRARTAVARASANAEQGRVVGATSPGASKGGKANFTLDFSLPEFDSGGDDPDSAPPAAASQRAEDLRREALSTTEVQQTQASTQRSGRPEIREIHPYGAGVVFKPGQSATSCGFSDADDVLIDGVGVGTLFTVRRRGTDVEVRSGSSLRPVLLNGSPVISAEAFPGDVFEVAGRRFEIRLTLGTEAAPGAETKLGIDSATLEAAIQARLNAQTDAVALVDVEAPSARPGSTAMAADGIRPLAAAMTLPRALVETSNEWTVDSWRSAPIVPAVEAVRDGPPIVIENIPIETVGVSDVAAPKSEDWLDSIDDAPRASDTLRTSTMKASQRKKRKKRAGGGTLPPPSFLPPVSESGD
jgi:pSer/pThr/pTyr-binding forkhead associated (FHA) protein